MVSLGDTAISHHILQLPLVCVCVCVWGGGDLESQNPKCQNLPNFQFFLGGGEVDLKPNSSLGVN